MADKNFKVNNQLSIGDNALIKFENNDFLFSENSGSSYTSLPTTNNINKAISTKTSDYTLTLSDANSIVETNITSNNRVTIPLDSTTNFPIGSNIDITQISTGQTQIVGETINLGPSDATTWVTQNSTFGTNTINTVAYGNGVWIAAGYSNQMRRSVDGVTWNTISGDFIISGVNLSISSVAYGNGTWVGVSFSNPLIRTSTDNGATWVSRFRTGSSDQVYQMIYANGIFTLVGNAIRTSPNGITWTTRVSGTYFRSIAYGNGLWVAGDKDSRIRTSSDNAVTWNVTKSTSEFNVGMMSIAYGNNMWLAGSANGKMYTSTNAITWVTASFTFGAQVRSISYNNNSWIIAGYSGLLKTSTDAITWITQNSTFGTNPIRSVVYQDGGYIAVGGSGQLRTSPPLSLSPSILSKSSFNKISTQYGSASLYKNAANSWILTGDLGA